MLAFKLALRNLLGAGLRTWLNVIVLSFSFIVIIWTKGLLEGWDRQAKNDMISWEIAGGQYWHHQFDPYDPFTLTDSHSAVPQQFAGQSGDTGAAAVLITQGTIYPQGRMQSVIIKGIAPDQNVIQLPTAALSASEGEIPAIIGEAMASSTGLKEGDNVILRWRDRNGTFDATEITIKTVFKTTVPTVDVGQVWLSLENLQEMMLMPGEATVLITGKDMSSEPALDDWVYKTRADLLADVEMIIKSKSAIGIIIWGIMLLMAMLAVFDTQVLSIFRRQKEIGTYVALGMTRGQVVGLFTLEGAMHSVLAALVGAVYGIPLLMTQSARGVAIPISSSDFGISMAERLYPVYSLGLIAGTVLTVFIVTSIVSYWPARKIAKMNPTEALRGRIQ
ncbi:ABC transporter permease [bacterium]|nr:ABC transporter permease [bacterium]